MDFPVAYTDCGNYRQFLFEHMELTASTFIEDGQMELRLNNKVIITNSGKISLSLDGKKEYVLSWKVVGNIGTAFTISISSPASSSFHLSRILGAEGVYTDSLTLIK